MKKLKSQNATYLEEYGVTVNKYLTTTQIQAIVNAILQFESWAEREQNKNILTLFFATDITKEEIEKADYDLLESSGLIENVISNIVNFNKIDVALEYEQSNAKVLKEIAKMIETEK